MISKISQQNIEHIFFFMMLDTAFYREKLNENRFVILIYYECRYAQFALSSTTIYLWLISLTASKELSILLLKLLKCMEQSGYISERQNLLLTLTSQYIIYGKGILGQ